MKTVLRSALLGLVTGASALGAWPASDSATATTSVVDVGWWTRSPFSSAPDGGLAVGDAPDGATAVGAVRLDLGAGVTSGSLELDEKDGFAQEAAVIVACRADESWTSEAGGNLEDAPEHRCGESPLELEPPEGDGTTWTIDITPIVGRTAGAVTVMLLPGEDADLGGTVGLGYEVRFGRPTLLASEVQSGTTTSPRSPSPSSDPPTSPEPATAPPAVAPGLTPEPVQRPAPPSSSPTSVADTTSTTADADFQAAPSPPSPGDDSGRPWGRFGLFALLASGIGAGAGGAHYLAVDRLGVGRPPGG